MLNELDTLESKIGQVVTLCHSLRAENDQLREQLAAAEGDKQGLAERMGAASARLEQLARQLPEAKV